MSEEKVAAHSDGLDQGMQSTQSTEALNFGHLAQKKEIIEGLKADLKAYKLRIPPNQQQDSFLSRLEEKLEKLEALGMEIPEPRNYQEFAGQSVAKVIKLVAELENHLAPLSKLFGAKNKL